MLDGSIDRIHHAIGHAARKYHPGNRAGIRP